MKSKALVRFVVDTIIFNSKSSTILVGDSFYFYENDHNTAIQTFLQKASCEKVVNDFRTYCPQRPCSIRREHSKKALCYSKSGYEFLLSLHSELIPLILESSCGRMEVTDPMTILSVPKECKINSNVVFIDKIYIKSVNKTSDSNNLRVINMQNQETSSLQIGDYNIGKKMMAYTSPEQDIIPDTITGDTALAIFAFFTVVILGIMIYIFCRKKRM